MHSAVTWAWAEDWGEPHDRGEQVRSGPYLGHHQGSVRGQQPSLTLPYGGAVVLQTFAVRESAPSRPVRSEEARIASNVGKHYDVSVLSVGTCMTAPWSHQRIPGPGTRCGPHCSRWEGTRRSRANWRILESIE